jgi:hypothetical protein
MTSPADPAAGVIPRIRARCPRCDYDLSGTVETWKGAPPPQPWGQCSECGTHVVWGKVLNQPTAPWWFVERDDSYSPRRYVCTALMLFRPVAFWKAVELGHRVRLRHAVLLAVVAMTLVPVSRTALMEVYSRTGWPGTLMVTVTGTTWTTFGPRWFHDRLPLTFNPALVLAILSLGLIIPWSIPLLSIIISESLKKAKVRLRHLLRVAIYHSTVMPLILIAVTALGAGMAAIGQAIWKGAWPAPMLDAYTGILAFVWFLYPLHTFLWWWAAYRFYMHLQRAFIGALLMVVCALLVAFIGMFTVGVAVNGIR